MLEGHPKFLGAFIIAMETDFFHGKIRAEGSVQLSGGDHIDADLFPLGNAVDFFAGESFGRVADEAPAPVKLVDGFAVGFHGVAYDVLFHDVEGCVVLFYKRNRVHASQHQVAFRGNLNISVHSESPFL